MLSRAISRIRRIQRLLILLWAVQSVNASANFVQDDLFDVSLMNEGSVHKVRSLNNRLIRPNEGNSYGESRELDTDTTEENSGPKRENGNDDLPEFEQNDRNANTNDDYDKLSHDNDGGNDENAAGDLPDFGSDDQAVTGKWRKPKHKNNNEIDDNDNNEGLTTIGNSDDDLDNNRNNNNDEFDNNKILDENNNLDDDNNNNLDDDNNEGLTTIDDDDENKDNNNANLLFNNDDSDNNDTQGDHKTKDQDQDDLKLFGPESDVLRRRKRIPLELIIPIAGQVITHLPEIEKGAEKAVHFISDKIHHKKKGNSKSHN